MSQRWAGGPAQHKCAPPRGTRLQVAGERGFRRGRGPETWRGSSRRFRIRPSQGSRRRNSGRSRNSGYLAHAADLETDRRHSAWQGGAKDAARSEAIRRWPAHAGAGQPPAAGREAGQLGPLAGHQPRPTEGNRRPGLRSGMGPPSMRRGGVASLASSSSEMAENWRRFILFAREDQSMSFAA